MQFYNLFQFFSIPFSCSVNLSQFESSRGKDPESKSAVKMEMLQNCHRWSVVAVLELKMSSQKYTYNPFWKSPEKSSSKWRGQIFRLSNFVQKALELLWVLNLEVPQLNLTLSHTNHRISAFFDFVVLHLKVQQILFGILSWKNGIFYIFFSVTWWAVMWWEFH